MTKSDYQETIEFLDGIVYALKDDGRYHDYFKDPKKLVKLRIMANNLFKLLPNLD